MIRFSLKKYFGAFLVLAVLLGFFFPDFGDVFHGKEDLLLMAIVFFNLLSVGISDITEKIKKPFRLILAILALNGLFSALVFLNKDFFSPEMFRALFLIGCSGISFSGLLIANIFNGEKASFLIIASVGLFISAFAYPEFFPELKTIDIITDTAIFLALPVFFSGLFRLSPYGESIEKYASYFSIVLFAILVYSGVSSYSNLVFSWDIAIVAMIFCVFNFLITLIIAKNRSERIAFSFATILRNFELLIISSVMSNQAEMAKIFMTFSLFSFVFLALAIFILSKMKD